MIKYKKLKSEEVSDYLEQIVKLYSQFSVKDKEISEEYLAGALKGQKTILMLALDGKKVVGMGLLCFVDMIRITKCLIEDVIVDEKYRGQGIGEGIVNHLIQEARAKKVEYIDLTSKPKRVAANNLYKKLGFQIRETNSYRMYLK